MVALVILLDSAFRYKPSNPFNFGIHLSRSIHQVIFTTRPPKFGFVRDHFSPPGSRGSEFATNSVDINQAPSDSKAFLLPQALLASAQAKLGNKSTSTLELKSIPTDSSLSNPRYFLIASQLLTIDLRPLNTPSNCKAKTFLVD